MQTTKPTRAYIKCGTDEKAVWQRTAEAQGLKFSIWARRLMTAAAKRRAPDLPGLEQARAEVARLRAAVAAIHRRADVHEALSPGPLLDAIRLESERAMPELRGMR